MNIVKVLCHCCKRCSASSLMVPCKIPGCQLFFYQHCLTSRYKYSYVKAAKLPSPHWKCPVCTHKCRCVECPQPPPTLMVQAENQLKGGVMPVRQQRTRKRIKKGKRKPPRDRCRPGPACSAPCSRRKYQPPFIRPLLFPLPYLTYYPLFTVSLFKPDGECNNSGKSVSYTHLTLPTNREV
eukprot:TRINITY_DN6047_c0_g1_i7.p1 TRINITY_DN6047_c0_g1~~TRINITY_DN6047_c0_g1_i7.p1  ORF type:complete len:181 (+),score=0.83 TRINITY_DN6047_c0_g1_i7:135-677(+)